MFTMKVAYVISSSATNWNLWDLVQHMERHSVELVPIFLDDGKGQTAAMLTATGRRFVALSVPRTRDILGVSKRLSATLKDVQPDLIHSNLFFPSLSVELARASTLRHVPSVLHRHHNIQHHLERKRLHAKVDSFTAKHATQVIAVSGRVKQTLVERESVPSTKVTVIYNGFDWQRLLRSADSWKPPPSNPSRVDEWRPYVSVVGRLDPIKDIPTVLRAFRLVANQTRGVDLRIAGAGSVEYMRFLRELADSLGVADRTHFMGHIENAPGFVLHSSCFVQASLDEACSQTIIEAIGVGTPAITTTSGGTAEIVAGVLEPLAVGDAETMAKRMQFVLHNPISARAEARARASAFRERFTVERQMEQFAEVYRRTLNA